MLFECGAFLAWAASGASAKTEAAANPVIERRNVVHIQTSEEKIRIRA
jgi:hypothetical protein